MKNILLITALFISFNTFGQGIGYITNQSNSYNVQKNLYAGGNGTSANDTANAVFKVHRGSGTITNGMLYNYRSGFKINNSDTAVFGSLSGVTFSYAPNASDFFLDGIYSSGQGIAGISYINLSNGKGIFANTTNSILSLQYKSSIESNDFNGFSIDTLGIATKTFYTNQGSYIQKWSNPNAEIMRVGADGNVGIGTATPAAILDVVSSTSGIIIPRVDTTERDAFTGAVNGMIIYNTDNNKFQGYSNNAWVDLN